MSYELGSSKQKNESILPSSKWSREEIGSDEENDGSTRDVGMSYFSGSDHAGAERKFDEVESINVAGHSTHLDSGVNEEQRQKLRNLEVSPMEYRESLEERGATNPEEIERKIASYQSRLQAENGLLDSSAGMTTAEKRGRDGWDDSCEHPNKCQQSESRNKSPPRRSSTRERDHREGDANRRDRERPQHNMDTDRGREREKSGIWERNAHDRDRDRESLRERDRRGR